MCIPLLKHAKNKNWNYTDTIMMIEDVIYDQRPKFVKEISSNFICLRDYTGKCIFVDKNYYNRFKHNIELFDKSHKMINVSNILKYKIFENKSALIANRTVPNSVMIESIFACKIERYNIYVCISEYLNSSDDLFKDLISLQTSKDRINMKERDIK